MQELAVLRDVLPGLQSVRQRLSNADALSLEERQQLLTQSTELFSKLEERLPGKGLIACVQ